MQGAPSTFFREFRTFAGSLQRDCATLKDCVENPQQGKAAAKVNASHATSLLEQISKEVLCSPFTIPVRIADCWKP
mgnify:CR=1 FL=1